MIERATRTISASESAVRLDSLDTTVSSTSPACLERRLFSTLNVAFVGVDALEFEATFFAVALFAVAFFGVTFFAVALFGVTFAATAFAATFFALIGFAVVDFAAIGFAVIDFFTVGFFAAGFFGSFGTATFDAEATETRGFALLFIAAVWGEDALFSRGHGVQS